MTRARVITALVALLVGSVSSPADAQTYPTRPITIVVPFAPGGGNDILARLLGQHMGRTLGQQFVIENRPGAAGSIGARAVAKASPDGYTLLVGHSGVFGVVPSLYGATRSPILPDVPTIAESGVPGYDAVIHYGMVAPAGTPRAVTARLNAALNDGLKTEDVRKRIADEGGDALIGTPEQQAADIDAEETKWGALVRKLGLKPE